MAALHPLLLPAQAPLRVVILALAGTPALMVGGLVDPLALRREFTVTLCSLGGRGVALAAGGDLQIRHALRDLEGDCLVVLAPPGADSRDAARALARASGRFGVMGGIGGGVALLAQAGLLEGRTVACPLDAEGRRAPFAVPARLRFTEAPLRIDADRITAASPGAASALALALIEARAGAAAAEQVARALGLAGQAPVPGEAPETEAPRPEAADPRVAAAIARMRASIAEPPSAAEIARDLNLSPRRLEGLFRAEFGTGPGGFALNLRLDSARRMLVETRMAVADIARATGFSSAGTLARAFRGRYDQSPSDVRRLAISETNHGLARRN